MNNNNNNKNQFFLCLSKDPIKNTSQFKFPPMLSFLYHHPHLGEDCFRFSHQLATAPRLHPQRFGIVACLQDEPQFSGLPSISIF